MLLDYKSIKQGKREKEAGCSLVGKKNGIVGYGRNWKSDENRIKSAKKSQLKRQTKKILALHSH